MGFLRPYRRQLWGSLAFAWAAMGMTVLIPWLIGRAVNAIESGDKPDLLPLALAIVGAGVLRLGLTGVRRVVAGRVSLAVEFDLRQRFYAHLQRLELGFFDSQQTGQLMSRATVDLQSIRFFLGYGLIFITQNLLTIALASAVMVALDPLLALLALAPAPLVVYTASRYNRVSRPALQEVQQRIAELTAEAEESVSGIRIVKAFAREEHQLHRFRRAVAPGLRPERLLDPPAGDVLAADRAAAADRDRPGPVGRRPPGDRRQPQPRQLHRLLHLRGDARRADADAGDRDGHGPAGDRLRQPAVRGPRPRAGDREPARGAAAARRRRPGRAARGDAALRRLPPPPPPAPALTGVDLDVEAGQTVALVGPSGSGKTSLVALIARLYDTSDGAVLLDGADVRSLDVASLRSQVAFVADDSFLFSASVADNIAYARPEASREEVEAAARRAQADEFIRDLPGGYDTRVGDRGMTLSGGQRQRVAIARALLARPRVLILDDATSAVDATTEASIKAGLREAMAGRTTFVIAHRLSTVSLADEVVVMDGGRIVDRGSHEELLEGCGFYREIAEHGLADSVFLQRDLERREELARL